MPERRSYVISRGLTLFYGIECVSSPGHLGVEEAKEVHVLFPVPSVGI